jgi:hypothetical protein
MTIIRSRITRTTYVKTTSNVKILYHDPYWMNLNNLFSLTPEMSAYSRQCQTSRSDIV